MPNHLQSKTMAGLAAILLIAIVAVCFGKLTQELVEVLKWVGGSFLAMRAVATGTENISGGPKCGN